MCEASCACGRLTLMERERRGGRGQQWIMISECGDLDFDVLMAARMRGGRRRH